MKEKGEKSASKKEKKSKVRILAFLGAAQLSAGERLSRLFKQGVSLDSRDGMGRSALHLSASVGFEWGVEFLIKAGADVDAQDDQGRSVVCYAAATNFGGSKIVELLVAAGADIEAGNALGYTPVMVAAGRGASGPLGALIKAGANVEAQALAGRCARDLAAQGSVAWGSAPWALCVELIDQEIAGREARRLDHFLTTPEEGARGTGSGTGKRRAL